MGYYGNQGMGLSNALDQYQQGAAWRQDQTEYARQQSARAIRDQAMKAAAATVADARKQHDTQAQGLAKDGMGTGSVTAKPFKMTPDLLSKAFDASSEVLGKAGDFEGLIANEARAAPVRAAYRSDTIQSAMQRFNVDGDAVRLAKTVYPVITDGIDIVGSEAVTGPDGQPAGYKLKLSDGTVTPPLTAQAISERVSAALANPQDVAKYEMTTKIKRFESDLKVREEQEKARADAAAKAIIEKVKHSNKTEEIGMESASREKVALGNNAATVKSAGLSASASRYGADKRVEASKYVADRGLDSAKERGASGKKLNPVKDFDQIHKLVQSVAGETVAGYAGGNKVGNEQTLNIARYAQALMESDPDIDPGDAVAQSLNEFKKRQK